MSIEADNEISLDTFTIRTKIYYPHIWVRQIQYVIYMHTIIPYCKLLNSLLYKSIAVRGNKILST